MDKHMVGGTVLQIQFPVTWFRILTVDMHLDTDCVWNTSYFIENISIFLSCWHFLQKHGHISCIYILVTFLQIYLVIFACTLCWHFFQKHVYISFTYILVTFLAHTSWFHFTRNVTMMYVQEMVSTYTVVTILAHTSCLHFLHIHHSDISCTYIMVTFFGNTHRHSHSSQFCTYTHVYCM